MARGGGVKNVLKARRLGSKEPHLEFQCRLPNIRNTAR